MPPKRDTRSLRSQLDREIEQVEAEHSRLVSARAALEGEAVVPTQKRKRFSQDEVAAYLAEHPASSYTEVAEGLGASAVNVAAHLSRGQKAGRFRNEDGKWSLEASD